MTNTQKAQAQAKRTDIITVTFAMSMSVEELMEFGFDSDTTIGNLIGELKTLARRQSGIRENYLGFTYESDGETIIAEEHKVIDAWPYEEITTTFDVGLDIEEFMNREIEPEE